MINDNYYHGKRAIRKIVNKLEGTGCLLGIFGSSVYGKNKGQEVKPNKNSDIDTNLILNGNLPIENLESLLNPIPEESLKLFEEGSIDILSLRGNYEGRPILFQCMNKGTLERVSNPDGIPLVMYKERKKKNKKVKPFYEFPIFGINEVGKDTTRIIPLIEGNLIIYKNTNFPNSNNFYLTLQQRQILTQEEAIDKENYLSQQRLLLNRRLRLKFPDKDLMGFFKEDLSEWSEDFKRKMELRLK